jgi:hypothetical protein
MVTAIGGFSGAKVGKAAKILRALFLPDSRRDLAGHHRARGLFSTHPIPK